MYSRYGVSTQGSLIGGGLTQKRNLWGCAAAQEALTLHPGETASGITLIDLDAHRGWARVELGTNQYVLRLVDRCGAAPPVNGIVSTRTQRFFEPSTGTSFGLDPVATGSGIDDSQRVRTNFADPIQSQASVNAFSSPRMNEYNGRPAETAPRGAQLATSTPTDNTPSPRPSQQDAAPLTQFAASTAGNATIVDLASLGIAASVSGNQSADGAPGTLTVNPVARTGISPDPLREQGEQIRTLYGAQAYLAWDLAQGKARYAAWSGQ